MNLESTEKNARKAAKNAKSPEKNAEPAGAFAQRCYNPSKRAMITRWMSDVPE
jgi:hypothetical protein